MLSYKSILFYLLAITVFFLNSCTVRDTKAPGPLLLDMVHHNPGEALTKTAFNDPLKLKDYGYSGKVYFLFEAAPFGIDWRSYDERVFPAGSESYGWVVKKQEEINKKYNEAKKAGLKVFCQMDMLVLPKSLVEIYKSEMTDSMGRIDLSKPKTQEALNYLIENILKTYPQLDGIVVRTGETYLQDAPYHTGNQPLPFGVEGQVLLINLLKKQICDKANKYLIYRTWDFGEFHSLPKYYLKVTDQIAPHPKLLFSIKHTQVDFWRGSPAFAKVDLDTLQRYWIKEASLYGVPFNPTLGIGKHGQIVEVQCQREYEGKGAHPIYIAKGVIEGFPENADLEGMHGLNEFIKDKNYRGVWTWSRGGGWGGPYINNELWIDLNAYVVAQWTQHPDKSEAEIFNDYATNIGIAEKSLDAFRQIALLSSEAIMKGEYSTYGGVYLNWLRDNTYGGLTQLNEISTAHLTQPDNFNKYIAEKQQAVKLWEDIVSLSKQVDCKDEARTQFIKVSSLYGLYKYKVACYGWEIMLYGLKGERTGEFQKDKIIEALSKYDQTWKDWNALKAAYPLVCPSLYVENYGKNQVPGLGASVDHFRKLVAH